MAQETSYKESISKQLADGFFSTTAHFCLVPEVLYQPENNDLWLNFSKETIAPTQEIAVEHITSQACYLLWEKDTAEKHIIAALLATEAQDAILAVLHEKQLVLVLILQGKLQLANVYPVEAQADILYHLLNIYTQWQLNPNALPTYLIGADEETTAFINDYVVVR